METIIIVAIVLAILATLTATISITLPYVSPVNVLPADPEEEAVLTGGPDGPLWSRKLPPVTAQLNADDRTIENVADPVEDTDAANKKYVLNATGGSAGGPTASVQYNVDNVFDGDGDFTYNATDKELTVPKVKGVLTTANQTNVTALGTQTSNLQMGQNMITGLPVDANAYTSNDMAVSRGYVNSVTVGTLTPAGGTDGAIQFKNGTVLGAVNDVTVLTDGSEGTRISAPKVYSQFFSSGPLDNGDNKITGVNAGDTGSTDACNVSQMEAAVAAVKPFEENLTTNNAPTYAIPMVKSIGVNDTMIFNTTMAVTLETGDDIPTVTMDGDLVLTNNGAGNRGAITAAGLITGENITATSTLTATTATFSDDITLSKGGHNIKFTNAGGPASSIDFNAITKGSIKNLATPLDANTTYAANVQYVLDKLSGISVPGSNTAVIFNNNGNLGALSTFTVDGSGNVSTNSITTANGMTVTSGDATVTAGNVTVTAGTLSVNAGLTTLSGGLSTTTVSCNSLTLDTGDLTLQKDGAAIIFDTAGGDTDTPYVDFGAKTGEIRNLSTPGDGDTDHAANVSYVITKANAAKPTLPSMANQITFKGTNDNELSGSQGLRWESEVLRVGAGTANGGRLQLLGDVNTDNASIEMRLPGVDPIVYLQQLHSQDATYTDSVTWTLEGGGNSGSAYVQQVSRAATVFRFDESIATVATDRVFRVANQSTDVFAVEKAGAIVNNGTFKLSSDRNLKENIEALTSQWDAIKTIGSKMVEFDYKGKEGRHMGWIAQDVEPHVPKSVYKDEEDNLQLDWAYLCRLQMKALAEAQVRIEQLESRLAILESE